MLTTRASNYLKTLERRPSIPVKEVEAIIRDQGFPVFDPWLDFHERYAGYVDIIYLDWAIWGLVHEDSYWLTPRKADITREPHRETWYITCADTHPTYNYQLTDKGEFLGHPAKSFDTAVEHLALLWEFCHMGKVRPLTSDELHALALRSEFLIYISQFLVEEASGNSIECYMSDTYLIESVGGFRRGWVKINA